ncbi:MAG: glycoside hydrolase [Acidobacteriia bacterium]|nr:glycoside hydrolase [Terriglobia bacterium]
MTRVVGVSALLLAMLALSVALIQLSTDTFTNPTSQHMTEVEPDTFSFGSMIVTAFQTGRILDGGSADIGFATSTNGGATWSNGFLPGITTFFQGGNFTAVSDPSVAFDSAHGVWMIASLAITNAVGEAVLVSLSSDGINWSNPVTVNNKNGFADKDWIACDNSASSPFFGHCYVEWDDAGNGDQIKMSVSTDGGQTWGAANTSSGAFGLGGQPVVQPNGTVVVPFEGVQAFTSTNGGVSWTRPVTVSPTTDHGVAGGLRTSALPSAEIDAAGTVYVVWQDCRFRTGCKSNDIVMSTSSDGKTWSAVSRIPIDPTTSTVDHFIPGIAVDPTTSGSTAHLGLTYYFYPLANCTSATCKLGVGFISSQDGGKTWSRATKVAGPMKTSWIANTTQGRMVGDYISTSYVNGKAFGVFAKAVAPTGGIFNEEMFTPATGLSTEENGPTFSSAGEQPVPGAHSDHGPRKFYDLEGQVPIPPEKQK